MLSNLLVDTQQVMMWVIVGVLAVLLVVWFVFSNKKNKQKQTEYMEQLQAIGPGNKVKTAGGICGVVVEVCDDNTVIIETGSELSGKSYVKMDKELIAQSDAKGPTQIARERAEAAKKAAKEAQPAAHIDTEAAKETPEEAPAEELAEAPAEAPVSEENKD